MELAPICSGPRRPRRFAVAAVLAFGLAQSELEEDPADVGLDRLLRHHEAFRDRPVRAPFGDQSKHLPFALAQVLDPCQSGCPREQALRDRLVDHAATGGDPLERVEQHVRVGHAVLQ